MRGEYQEALQNDYATRELPPRAWRIRLHHPARLKHHRTTSACAENTYDPYRNGKPPWNYLRVCGEYTENLGGVHPRWELPPRARRILGQDVLRACAMGTTSACAENTVFLASLAWSVMELPPRARRIRHQHAGGGRDPGTTSACAENTCRAQSTPPPHGNYLRVRGEYAWVFGVVKLW